MNLSLLRSRMQELNMSKSQLIKVSGVSESTANRIFRGKTDVHTSTLRMIAAAVDLDPAVLLDENAPVPESFDPSNVPEISAAVLEKITEIEQNEPQCAQNDLSDGHMAPRVVTNDTPGHSVSASPECEVFYERMIKYLRDKLDAAYTANEQIRLQNTELIKSNALLREQDRDTRARNRSLYAGIIIACIVAGLALAGLVAYFVYDIMSPAWGIFRY